MERRKRTVSFSVLSEVPRGQVPLLITQAGSEPLKRERSGVTGKWKDVCR